MNNNNLRVYYAHSKKTYDSAKEKDELAFIKSKYPKTICPNTDLGELNSMDSYLKIVAWSDLVIISEYFGHIGKGVYKEINEASKNNIPILILRERLFYKIKGVVVVDKLDAQIKYAKVII